MQALERRLKAWQAGDIVGLLREGRTIQHSLLPHYGKKTVEEREEQRARIFSKLVFAGKMHAAM